MLLNTRVCVGIQRAGRELSVSSATSFLAWGGARFVATYYP
jgi:hypothetical protein